ncbi:YrhB domain-containing protein [Streptomyces sp. NPDC026673]|uniref:YrhB domain-containing protein n=1 Tax=Streptomyces sp. NPDC026673 TaxID=3155724 RepID=UPI0033D6F885
MIEREEAVRRVQDHLDRLWPGRMAVVDAEEHELAWVVLYQSAEYVRTGDQAHLLGGNGPCLVDRVDGRLYAIGPVDYVTGEWEEEYRARVRGLPVRTAVDDLDDRIREWAAAHGRVHAMVELRTRVPGLAPSEALAYVTALRAGRAAPEELVGVVTKALVPEPRCAVLAVEDAARRRPGRG